MPPDDDVDCKYCDGTSCVFLYQAKNKKDALEQKDKQFGLTAVSYTHLTLPTKNEV